MKRIGLEMGFKWVESGRAATFLVMGIQFRLKPGTVLYCDFNGYISPEMLKCRPVVVVSPPVPGPPPPPLPVVEVVVEVVLPPPALPVTTSS